MAVEQEWAKRVRAAAAYAGIGYADLAEQLGMSDSTLRRHLAAQKRPHEQRALTQTVADLTGLPYEFFTVDYAQLPELLARAAAPAPDLADQVRDLLRGPEFREALVGALYELDPAVLQRVAADVAEREPTLEELTRRTKQALVDPEAPDAQAKPTAADTQTEEGANPGAAQSPGGATRRSAGRTGA